MRQRRPEISRKALYTGVDRPSLASDVRRRAAPPRLHHTIAKTTATHKRGTAYPNQPATRVIEPLRVAPGTSTRGEKPLSLSGRRCVWSQAGRWRARQGTFHVWHRSFLQGGSSQERRPEGQRDLHTQHRSFLQEGSSRRTACESPSKPWTNKVDNDVVVSITRSMNAFVILTQTLRNLI